MHHPYAKPCLEQLAMARQPRNGASPSRNSDQPAPDPRSTLTTAAARPALAEAVRLPDVAGAISPKQRTLSEVARYAGLRISTKLLACVGGSSGLTPASIDCDRIWRRSPSASSWAQELGPPRYRTPRCWPLRPLGDQPDQRDREPECKSCSPTRVCSRTEWNGSVPIGNRSTQNLPRDGRHA
jgi:hypothetical protein